MRATLIGATLILIALARESFLLLLFLRILSFGGGGVLCVPLFLEDICVQLG